jgi:hypothetical protein
VAGKGSKDALRKKMQAKAQEKRWTKLILIYLDSVAKPHIIVVAFHFPW